MPMGGLGQNIDHGGGNILGLEARETAIKGGGFGSIAIELFREFCFHITGTSGTNAPGGSCHQGHGTGEVMGKGYGNG